MYFLIPKYTIYFLTDLCLIFNIFFMKKRILGTILFVSLFISANHVFATEIYQADKTANKVEKKADDTILKAEKEAKKARLNVEKAEKAEIQAKKKAENAAKDVKKRVEKAEKDAKRNVENAEKEAKKAGENVVKARQNAERLEKFERDLKKEKEVELQSKNQ